MESLSNFIENYISWLNGFLMAGIILILIGIKSITVKDIREYKLSHINVSRLDEAIAWGIFYLIFGILITAAVVVSFIS